MKTAQTTGSANYPQWGLSWTYDPYGNRLSQSQTYDGPPTSSVTVNPATNRITDRGNGYDANGNMTGDGLNTLTYDGENRVVTSATGGTTSSYTYDGKNLRVKKQVGSATATVYIFSGSKVVAEYAAGAGVGSPTREYIYSGSQLLATIEGSTTKYHHADHLSVRVTSDISGNVLGQQGHYPFGEQWYPAPPTNPATKWQFTSYERDGASGESGNDYAMMRYHVNRLGRFSSPDPIAGSLANPQSLNRYAYVLNDPGNLIDPKGTISVNFPFGIDPLFVLAAIGPHTDVTVYGDASNEETILLGSGPLEQLLAGHQGSRGGGPPGIGPPRPPYKKCKGEARVIGPGLAGRRGAFGRDVRQGSASVIPTQFFGGAQTDTRSVAAARNALAPYASQIFGFIGDPESGVPITASFSHVDDVIGGDEARRNLVSTFGADTLFVELNGGGDQGTKPVVLFVPSNLDCPRGTVQVGQ